MALLGSVLAQVHWCGGGKALKCYQAAEICQRLVTIESALDAMQ